MENKILPLNGHTREYIEACKKTGLRRCSMCKTIKPVNKFYRGKDDYKHYSSRCKSCTDTVKMEYSERHRNNSSDAYITARLIGTFLTTTRRLGGTLAHKDVKIGISTETIHAKRNLLSLEKLIKQKSDEVTKDKSKDY